MISKSIKILLLEDNPGDARLIQEMLSEARGAQLHLKCVDRLSTGLEHLAAEFFDIIMLDLSLPDSLGFDTFIRVHAQVPKVPIIILSGLDDELMAVKAVQGGAQDYLVKAEVNTNLLVRSILYAIERKRIEDALRDSEQQYRSSINSMRDAIHAIDTDLRIVLFNNSFKQWNKKLGLGTDVIGMDLFEVFPFLPDSVRNEYRKVFDTGKTIITEEETKLGDEEFITETRKVPVYEAGRISRIITIVRDITKRKRAEEKLKLSEEKYSNLFQYSHDGIIIHDLEGNIIDVNKKAVYKFGYNREEILSLKIPDLHPVEALDTLEYAFKKVSQDGFVLFEIDFKEKNGEVFPAEVSSSLFEVGGQKIIQGIIRDITKRKNAEKALKDSESKFRALSENSPNMIFINKMGRVVYANKKCEEIMGYKKEEFYSKDFDFLVLIAPESREKVKVNFNRHMNGEDIPPFEIINITKEGKRIESLLTTRFLDYEGEKAILGIVTDIGKLKEAERILKQDKETFERLVDERTKELVKIQKKLMNAKRLSEIGTLAATVAHELRNPLGVIFTAVFNIKRKNKNPSLEKHLANIERHVMESNQIIDNLLSYSYIKMPNYENIDISEILNEVINTSKDRFKKKKVIFSKKFISIKNIFIEADPLQIKVMFINILNNAYDALTENEGRIEVVGSYNGSDFIKVYFKDNGSGISKEDLKRVYEPFFSSKLKGTGLGLTLCNQIVSLHDGKMKIESEKGKGTTVMVKLPIKQKK